MKPVLILQHLRGDGPAYLATWLAAHGIAADVRDTEAGDPYPESIDGHAALAILGGAMSANDPLPSLRQAEALVVQAVARDVPVIGHCLGGQLMARALGAAVTASPQPEVGWHAMQVVATPAAQAWFGDASEHLVFQWHEEAFGVPDGAVRLAGSAQCPNQAFAIGPHLAMQFHVELDAAKLARWAADEDPRYLAQQARWPTVHGGARLRRDTEIHLAAQQRLADRIYARWIASAR